MQKNFLQGLILLKKIRYLSSMMSVVAAQNEEFLCTSDKLLDVNKSVSTLGVSPFQKQTTAQKKKMQ